MLAVMVMAVMFSACSVAVPVFHRIVREKIEGVIYTTDGNEYQGLLYAPNALTKKLTLTTNDYNVGKKERGRLSHAVFDN